MINHSFFLNAINLAIRFKVIFASYKGSAYDNLFIPNFNFKSLL